MSFSHPSIAALAIIAAAIFAALYLHAERSRVRSALSYSNLQFLIAAAQPRAWPARAAAAAWIGAVALVALAFAGPRIRAVVPVRGGAVVLCIDTSGSMAAQDVQPTRADAALAALREFIDRTPQQTAIGIVSFAGTAQEIVPPTRDRDVLRAGLQQVPAPNGATAIGDAFLLAQRMMPPRGHRAVVLITDGQNNTGLDPMQQAQLLGGRGIKLYTIGIGTNNGALIPGTLQEAGIDEDALRAYARATGGAYSRADDASKLREALARLGRTTAFARGTVDVSLATAAFGALLMVTTFLWTRLT
jgi:Ca-activated chloride channel family protein